LQTGQRVDRGDMDTYFVMYRWVRHLYYNKKLLHAANSHFCVSQGSAASLFRRGGGVYRPTFIL